MGIALAGICQIKNYRCTIVMPDNMSEKRKQLISKHGAKLILTPGKLGMNGAIEKVHEILRQSTNVYYTNQFLNYASVEAHILTTAPEINTQLNGRVDVIIAGIGTGATTIGLSTFFKKINPTIKIIGILPNNYPHKIQGIGAGFKPPLISDNLIDEIINVSDEEAFDEMEKIYTSEGISVGISSGAVIAGLKKLIKSNEYNSKNVVLIFADGNDRY